MQASSKRIYLDYAAPAPFDLRLAPVLESASWANANSLYAEGKQAAGQLRAARKRIAVSLGAHAPSEIIFTSGGSESVNMAIKGLASQIPNANKTHVVVSAIEHDAVLNAADSIKSQGYRVTRVTPNSLGIIMPAALEDALQAIENVGDATCLVAIQSVNNEVGSIQPIEELAEISHRHGSLFFADAVQALGKLEINLEQSGVDACAFSAHKIGALKGSGVLYVRSGLHIKAFIHGGGQEHGLRSGTSNVMGALAFAQAIEYAMAERDQNWEHALMLRKTLVDGIAASRFKHALAPTLADCSHAVPHIISLLCDGIEGETLVLRLDDAGFATSSGSACSTGALDPSHVRTARGVPKDRAYGSLRISFCPDTSLADIEALLDALPEVLR